MPPSTEGRPSHGSNQASRRRLGRIIREAALGSYGVAAVSGPRWYDRLLARLGRGTPGVAVEADDGLRVEVHLKLAEGVPPPAVASNVEESVRYVVQRELGRAIDRLTLFVDGVPLQSASETGAASGRPGPHTRG